MIKNKINEAQFLIDLNKPRGDGIKVGLKTALHDGQIKMLAPLYDPKIQIVMAPSARKFGKSEACLYAAYRHCALNPGSIVYIVGPEKTHIADIYWDGQRAQRFLGDDSDKYIEKVKDRERMIIFKNTSVLKLMGSENWKAGQGLSPDLIIYDEFKAFHPKFHTEMAPNVAAKGAKFLIVGTQPQAGDRNKTEYEAVLARVKKNPASCSYAEYTTFDNPIMHLPANKAAIEEHIAQLREAGDEATVQREYYSRIIPGGSRSIFPMFRRDKHVKRHAFIMDLIKNNERQFDWYCVIDPAGSSTYAASFLATHTKTKHTFLLDELYIKDRMLTSTKHVIPLIKEKMLELNPNMRPKDWIKVCDEQASHHIIEIVTNYPDMAFMASQKLKNNKDEMHMTLKDMFTYDKLIFSDRCVNASKEIEEYATNAEGLTIKNRHSLDHLIDTLVYFLHTSRYTLAELLEGDRQAPEGWVWFKDGFRPLGHIDYTGFNTSDDDYLDSDFNLLDQFEDDDFW